MAADKAFMEKIVEKLAPLGDVKSRVMFGGYGIFYEGNMFALISGSTLFLKADAANLDDFKKAGSKQYKPMPYYEAPVEIINDAGRLREWAKKSIAIPPKKK